MSYHAQWPLWNDKSPDQKLDSLRQMIDDLYRYTLSTALENLSKTLDAHQPTDEKEASDLAIMQSMIKRYPNILSPLCEVGHFTGSGLIIDRNGQVLLHYHKSLGRWLQFGGHAEHETDFACVALREATEESGLNDLRLFPNPEQPKLIDLDVHSIPEGKGRPEHLHLDLRYLLMTDTPEAIKASEGESSRFAWIPFDEALNHANPYNLSAELRRLINKAKHA